MVSLPNLALTSAIAWPLDGLSATFPDPFAPSSRVAADWRQDIKVNAANAHVHNVTLAVRDAELSAVNLIESGGAVRLGAPWTFPALATHTLKGGSTSLTWTSVDEIVVGHVSALEREAAQTLDTPPGELGFVARYRDSVASNLQALAVSAAVFSKAMARAGIPTLELLISLRLAQKARAASGSGGATPVAASDLFISGAALIEVAAEKDDTLGHRVVTPWIAPLFDGKALGVLGSIPQAPWNGRVSSYDLAPHTAGRLDLESAVPFGTSDASIAWIKRFRERIAGSLPQQQIPRFEPVSQSIIEDTELPSDGANPAHWLSRPIWLRTLAAWKGILNSTPGAAARRSRRDRDADHGRRSEEFSAHDSRAACASSLGERSAGRRRCRGGHGPDLANRQLLRGDCADAQCRHGGRSCKRRRKDAQRKPAIDGRRGAQPACPTRAVGAR